MIKRLVGKLRSFYKHQLQNEKIRRNVLEAFPFWLASFITGVIAVAYTQLFNWAETALHYITGAVDWLIFLLAPLCFLAAWLVVQRFSKGARGSGIPQIMAVIDLTPGKHDTAINRLLSIRVIIIKIVSSLLMVLGGGAVGREGPTIQIAGSVFRVIHRLIPANWPRASQKSYVLTGAAAGLSAAFNTPLGGIVFAIEELAKVHLTYFRTALFTAVIIAGLTAQTFLGPYLYLGYPQVGDLHKFIFLVIIAVAVIAACGGAMMSSLILRLMKWKSRFNRRGIIVLVLGTGLVFASVSFFFNDALLGSGKSLMNQTLFTEDKRMPLTTVLLRVLGPALTFNVGAAGGVFAPSLAAGASVGAWMAQVFGFLGSNANILILSGMVAFLTGVTRTPFTSAILVLEMTDRHSVIFHLMLAGLVGSLAARFVSKNSLYESLKKNYLAEAKREAPAPPH